MAKTKKRSGSAAQRREQVREQRQQRLNADQNPQNQGRRSPRKRQSNRSSWWLIGGLLAVVVIVIGVFVFLSNQQQSSSAASQANVQKTLSTLDPKEFATVGTGNAKNLFRGVPSNTAVINGPGGKPQVLYVGADYCPFCGAQRWSLAVALSRFGSFNSLPQISSAENNIPTFSFHQVSYKSQYIDFVALETVDNNNRPLDVPTAEQQKLLDTYNAPPYTSSKGSIPFLMLGNKWVSTGAFFDPQILVGISHEEIAKQVADPNSEIGKGVVGSANYITAGICQMTNNQPANVCTADPIPTVQTQLSTPTGTVPVSGSQASLLNGPFAILPRRQA